LLAMAATESLGGNGPSSAFGRERFVLYVGDKSCGKSTLKEKFLGGKSDKLKPTTALDYTYARKTVANNRSKDVAHIWELGGGKKLSPLVQVPLTPGRLPNAVVIIVLDMSRPNRVFESLERWLSIVRGRVQQCLQEMQRTHAGKKAARAMIDAAHERMKRSEDTNNVDPCAVPIAIVAMKYDLFEREDPARRKVLLSALRYVAHSNGASLYCASRRDAGPYRKLMNHLCFRSELRGGTYPLESAKLDWSKPLYINAGRDAVSKIGVPQGATRADFENGNISKSGKMRLERWRSAVNSPNCFPLSLEEQHMDEVENDVENEKRMWAEDKIDRARAEGEERLIQYKRDVERRRRLNNA